MSIPLSIIHYDNVFVHEGGKLEKRQFLAKMRQIAPIKIASQISKFSRGRHPRTPFPGEGDTPSSDPSPTRRFALRLVAFSHLMVPP